VKVDWGTLTLAVGRWKIGKRKSAIEEGGRVLARRKLSKGCCLCCRVLWVAQRMETRLEIVWKIGRRLDLGSWSYLALR
jgi:hypothetical protein